MSTTQSDLVYCYYEHTVWCSVWLLLATVLSADNTVLLSGGRAVTLLWLILFIPATPGHTSSSTSLTWPRSSPPPASSSLVSDTPALDLLTAETVSLGQAWEGLFWKGVTILEQRSAEICCWDRGSNWVMVEHSNLQYEHNQQSPFNTRINYILHFLWK